VNHDAVCTRPSREREYFVDGLHEEIISRLGRLRPDRLGVIARTSTMQYKATTKSIATIGEELGVHYILEGSVRQAGERVRVTAQLIQVSDQAHVWAETFEREFSDLFSVQAEALTWQIRLNWRSFPKRSPRRNATRNSIRTCLRRICGEGTTGNGAGWIFRQTCTARSIIFSE
jgi:TolB-like protein